ncbi:hypothetical protein ANHYDRO_00365 [Anaerococcus hydrogenalis DSM 7454]|uniref:HD domain-containing protein n=1 Tax=Anaerococcus hydrogenalis DSM 7454 TaxID=561177 RepID=B6W709_9FIRM|nr:hypothetical protein [Anaerococcus hydrogenalis]EEB36764.1 hypothetical protein ANHYDRO_00365 [Anaerococcus hydrogenalis DSM 7454]
MLILEILNEDKWLDDYKFFKDFKNSSYYETLLDTYQNLNTDILYKSRIHGQGHIERVILLSLLLSFYYKLNKNDTDILRYAASLHDTKRVDDSYDTEHGYRAALYSIDYAKIDEKDKNILQAVLATHSRSDKDMDKTIEEFFVKDMDRARYLSKLFKDADALDRVRLGDLDQKYLRNDFSHDLVDFSDKLFEKYMERQ